MTPEQTVSMCMAAGMAGGFLFDRLTSWVCRAPLRRFTVIVDRGRQRATFQTQARGYDDAAQAAGKHFNPNPDYPRPYAIVSIRKDAP